MNHALQIPTVELVKAACEKFDRENELSELALAELFRQYPHNGELTHILLKVVAVNSLYRTNIFALEAVARHIRSNVPDIDALVASGSPEVVNTIARISIGGKKFNFFSFATKYCSWHNPEAYPIYDSRVDDYLWTLQKQSHFAGFLHADLWDYPKFLNIVTSFREFYGLGSFTFKDLDKFLYLQCEPPCSTEEEMPRPDMGAFDFFPAEEMRS